MNAVSSSQWSAEPSTDSTHMGGQQEYTKNKCMGVFLTPTPPKVKEVSFLSFTLREGTSIYKAIKYI